MAGARRRQVLFLGGALGLTLLLAWIGVALQAGGLQSAANVATLVSAVLAVPPLAAGLLAWRRSAKRVTSPSTADLVRAKNRLAGLVRDRANDEAIMRALDRPYPMPVQWRLTRRGDAMDHLAQVGSGSFAGSSDQIADLAKQFRALRRRRLVILGGPGTGKTTLAIQLLLELLASRRHDEPVPVFVSVTGWDTDAHPRLQEWLAHKLGQDYRTLVERAEVLPVLDGLDELPAAARTSVIDALNQSLGSDNQLILTSRVDEFIQAIRTAGFVLNAAAVIEPEPLTPAVAAGYLRACLPPTPPSAWEEILTGLEASRPPTGPITALAETVATPLGLWLLRTTYVTRNARPERLLQPDIFPTAEALRGHLFDRLIPVLFSDSLRPGDDPSRPLPRRRYDPGKVRRWLANLAVCTDLMPKEDQPTFAAQGHGTRDFRWWRLALVSLRRRVLPTVHVLAGVLLGAAGGAIQAAVVGRAVYGGPSGAITGFGALGGLIGGLTALKANAALHQDPRFADLHSKEQRSRLYRFLLWGALAGPASLLVIQLVLTLANQVWKEIAGKTTRWLSQGSLTANLEYALLLGLVLGLAFGFAAWNMDAPPADRASTPMGTVRAEREVYLLRIGAYVLCGASLPLAGQLYGQQHELAFGTLLFGFLALIIGMLTGPRTWLAYLTASCYLASTRALPLRLMPFLDDAHHVGLLRAVGPIYQFRHAELQDYLAAPYRSNVPSQTRRPTLLRRLWPIAAGAVIGAGISGLYSLFLAPGAHTTADITYNAILSAAGIITAAVMVTKFYLHRR
jgi:NACHT domain-containing protein